MKNKPQLSIIDKDGVEKTLGDIKPETVVINEQEPNNRIKWYGGIYPYDEIIKTSEQEPYLFALLLNDKLVAIGSESVREGGVFRSYNIIFNSWVDLRKNFSNYQKHVENVINRPSDKINKLELFMAKEWQKLFDLIKDKKFLGKLELPPQPRQMLYRTTWNNEMYIIYENKWKQPKRFSLWSSNKEFFANSDKLSNITEQLSTIVGRNIHLVQ